jgi:hypothetical protein
VTHFELVTDIVRTEGPVSDAAIYHYARARGFRPSAESIRTRRSEAAKAGLVKEFGTITNRRGRVLRTWVAA